MVRAKRIIPCMDIQNGKIVKGVQFKGIREVADPVTMAEVYSKSGADELVFYDINASNEGRGVFEDLFKQVVAKVKIPLTVGGGIAATTDVERMLAWGADKVSVNSGVIKRPELLAEAAKEFGSQRIVFAMDIKKVGDNYHVFAKGGREDSGIDAIEWAKRGEAAGAGELVANSIDTDGVKNGFDLALLGALSAAVKTPIVASGGAGNMQHFLDLFEQIPAIEAGLAASVFHFGEIDVMELKKFLRDRGIVVEGVNSWTGIH